VTVTHISTSGAGGGAPRATLRLHHGLQSIGIKSSVVARRNAGSEDIIRFRASSGLSRRLHRFAREMVIRASHLPYFFSLSNSKDLFTDDRSRFDQDFPQNVDEPDIFNLHWVANFVDVRSFFLHTTSPIVWTMHDMNPFTGGCHYSFYCSKYTEMCGRCPQLGSTDDQDLSRSVWERKQDAFETAIREDRLYVVSPSRWLAREAERSALLRDVPTHVIPNSVDHSVFRPREDAEIRNLLNITGKHKIVLFVAQSPSNYRKGFDLLIEALNDLDDLKSVTLVSIGKGEPDISTAANHVHAGFIEQDDMLSHLYSLADLFVIPSRQDNLPNTVLEAMACGTPVIGFDMGGIPDMVRPNETGWLAETGDVRSLREAIEQALAHDDQRRRMSTKCREVVEEEYTLEKQANQYLSLYRSILN